MQEMDIMAVKLSRGLAKRLGIDESITDAETLKRNVKKNLTAARKLTQNAQQAKQKPKMDERSEKLPEYKLEQVGDTALHKIVIEEA